MGVSRKQFDDYFKAQEERNKKREEDIKQIIENEYGLEFDRKKLKNDFKSIYYINEFERINFDYSYDSYKIESILKSFIDDAIKFNHVYTLIRDKHNIFLVEKFIGDKVYILYFTNKGDLFSYKGLRRYKKFYTDKKGNYFIHHGSKMYFNFEKEVN